jgi:hypothetical protein
VALFAASSVSIVYEMLVFRKEKLQEISGLADLIGANCRVPLIWDRSDEAERVLSYLNTYREIQLACIYHEEKIWAHYPAEARDAVFPSVDTIGEARFAGRSLELVRPIRRTENWDEQVIGKAYLKVTLESHYARAWQYVGIMVGGGLRWPWHWPLPGSSKASLQVLFWLGLRCRGR